MRNIQALVARHAKVRGRIKTGEPKDFYLGYLGLLLNNRRVHRAKSKIETQLPGVPFAASEGQLADKINHMMELGCSMEWGLVFSLSLMLDRSPINRGF